MSKNEKVTAEYISTSLLGSGYAAIHMVEINGEYWDVQQTGIGRFRTKEPAVIEAKQWAEAEEIEYRE